VGGISVRVTFHATRKRVRYERTGEFDSNSGQIDAQRRVRSDVRPTDA